MPKQLKRVAAKLLCTPIASDTLLLIVSLATAFHCFLGNYPLFSELTAYDQDNKFKSVQIRHRDKSLGLGSNLQTKMEVKLETATVEKQQIKEQKRTKKNTEAQENTKYIRFETQH
ncbi:hypothetical protein PMAC_000383 [Pneumocystis sp. 'macacae']|nr:hypothetical protein PMAC_000383 [Pneumocystis sp. 'macacae']